MKIDIKKYLQIIAYIMLIFPFFVPSYITNFILSNDIVSVMRLASFAIALILILVRNKISSNILWFIIYGFILFITNYFAEYGSSIMFMCNQLFITLGIVVLSEHALKSNARNFITAAAILFTAYTIINFITIIMYPNGMYSVDDIKNNWFLGYKNSHIRYMIFAILFNFLRIKFKDKKIDIYMIILLIISFISVVLIDSSTSIVGLSILSIYFIFPKLFSKIGKRSYKLYVIIAFVICALMLIGSFQDSFSYVIESLLDRDVTLTNRTIIWEANMQEIKDNFVLGHGVESEDLRISRVGVSGAVNAHNIYLEILYQGGILLFISFMAIIVKTGVEIKKCEKDEIVNFISLAIGAILVMSVTEVYPIYMVFMLLNVAMNIKHIYKDEIKSVEEGK